MTRARSLARLSRVEQQRSCEIAAMLASLSDQDLEALILAGRADEARQFAAGGHPTTWPDWREMSPGEREFLVEEYAAWCASPTTFLTQVVPPGAA